MEGDFITALAVTLASMWGRAWPIIVAVLYFGFLILSHEIGHFSAARALRVRVSEFNMGMGPRLFKRKRGETLYSVKAVPFGGSVVMEEDEAPGDDPRAFGNQKPWKRFVILSAGAFVNILCGVIIMAFIVGMSPSIMSTRVESFRAEAISDTQGLQAGDQVVKIDGKRVFSGMDVGFLFARSKSGKVDLIVRRDGRNIKLEALRLLEFTSGESEGKFYYFDFYLQEYDKCGPGLFVKETIGQSATIARMVWLSLFDMVTGKFQLRDISGPIGVVTILSTSAQEVQTSPNKADALASLLNLMLLFSMISINIGLMNLLPLPALDGGRLFFCAAEMIFRKPIPKKLEGYVHAAGFALLMLFMVIITFSDVWSLITGKR